MGVMMRAFILIAVITAIGVGSTPGADQMMRRLYVTNSQGDDVTIIDLGTLKVVGDIKVGDRVHGVCAPADGKTVFFTIESAKTLRIVDTATNEITATIPLTGDPNQCAATPDGHFAIVPIRDVGGIDIVDISEKKVVKILPIRIPHNCYNTGSNDVVYCESMADQQINRINMKTLEYDQKLASGGVPRPFAVSKDEKTIYAALTNFHGFVEINTAEGGSPQRVELPAQPTPSPCEKFEPNTPTHGLALSPNGKELWVTSLADSGVYVYEIASKKTSKEISTGSCPNWISFSQDGKYVTVSNSASNDSSIIDAKSRKEVARVKVGNVPKRLLVINVPMS
jgi:YVTN family beta-propeller protein